MRVLTVLGTRPEIIRLSRIIPRLDELCEHTVVHTGQNYDERLDRIFFEHLHVREPDVHLGIRAGTFGEQIGKILTEVERVLLAVRPDRLLVLGDTDSGMAAIVARRLGIPVYHLEAGNRCFDDRVPEEVNRRVIDHCSTVLLAYTQNSKVNLLREGIPSDRIYVVGNPIKEVLDAFASEIDASSVLEDLGLQPEGYFLVTLHRSENVDVEARLRCIVGALESLHVTTGLPVVCSFHPRTRSKFDAFGIDVSTAGVRFLPPFGFFDFVRLENSAHCILTDSGTVSEEACILGIPAVTIRDVTERPETLECGSNILSGGDPKQIVAAARLVAQRRGGWAIPQEYEVADVSETVARIVIGYRTPSLGELSWQAVERT